jgi:hypothetical protein
MSEHVNLTEKLRKLAEFDEVSTQVLAERELATDGGVNTWELVAYLDGARAENARIRPLLDALLECAQSIQEHVECEPGMYANECIGLGGADGLCEALARLTAIAKERGDG